MNSTFCIQWTPNVLKILQIKLSKTASSNGKTCASIVWNGISATIYYQLEAKKKKGAKIWIAPSLSYDLLERDGRYGKLCVFKQIQRHPFIDKCHTYSHTVSEIYTMLSLSLARSPSHAHARIHTHTQPHSVILISQRKTCGNWSTLAEKLESVRKRRQKEERALCRALEQDRAWKMGIRSKCRAQVKKLHNNVWFEVRRKFFIMLSITSVVWSSNRRISVFGRVAWVYPIVKGIMTLYRIFLWRYQQNSNIFIYIHSLPWKRFQTHRTKSVVDNFANPF